MRLLLFLKPWLLILLLLFELEVTYTTDTDSDVASTPSNLSSQNHSDSSQDQQQCSLNQLDISKFVVLTKDEKSSSGFVEVDKTEYLLEKRDNIYRYRFKDCCKCSMLKYGDQIVWTHDFNKYGYYYPIEISIASDNFDIKIKNHILSYTFKNDQWILSCKARFETDNYRNFTIKTLDDNSITGFDINDNSQFDTIKYPSGLLMLKFEDEAKCVELKYENKLVWQHDENKYGNQYPKSILYKPDGYLYIDFDPSYYAYVFDSISNSWVLNNELSYKGHEYVYPSDHPECFTIITADDVIGTNLKENNPIQYKVYSYFEGFFLYVFDPGVVCHEFRYKDVTLWKYDGIVHPRSITVDFGESVIDFEFGGETLRFRLSGSSFIRYTVKNDLKGKITGLKTRIQLDNDNSTHDREHTTENYKYTHHKHKHKLTTVSEETKPDTKHFCRYTQLMKTNLSQSPAQDILLKPVVTKSKLEDSKSVPISTSTTPKVDFSSTTVSEDVKETVQTVPTKPKESENSKYSPKSQAEVSTEDTESFDGQKPAGTGSSQYQTSPKYKENPDTISRNASSCRIDVKDVTKVGTVVSKSNGSKVKTEPATPTLDSKSTTPKQLSGTQVTLEIVKKDSSDEYFYNEDDSEDLRIYTAKQGCCFNKVVENGCCHSDCCKSNSFDGDEIQPGCCLFSWLPNCCKSKCCKSKCCKSACSDCCKQLVIWEAGDKTECSYKVILKGIKNYPKYLLILPVVGEFVLYYKDNKDAEWCDITILTLQFSNFKFFGFNKSSSEVKGLCYCDIERSTVKFSYGYKFKDGVKCTKIIYYGVIIWTYSNNTKDPNNPSRYPLGLYYHLVDKELRLYFDNTNTAILKTQIELDIEDDQCSFYDTSQDTINKTYTFTAKDQYLFRIVKQGPEVIWETMDLTDNVEKVLYEGVDQDKKKITIFMGNGTSHVFEKSSSTEPWNETIPTLPSEVSGDSKQPKETGKSQDKQDNNDQYKKPEEGSDKPDELGEASPKVQSIQDGSTPVKAENGEGTLGGEGTPSGTPTTPEAVPEAADGGSSTPSSVPIHPVILKITTEDGSSTKENDATKYTLKQYGKFYKFEFKDDAKCKKVVCGTTTWYEHGKNEPIDKYPKEIYYNSDTYYVYLGLYKTKFVSRYDLNEWKSESGGDKKIINSKFMISTEGSTNPNDSNKFDETNEGSFVKCKFKHGVKSTKVEYENKVVYKYDQSKNGAKHPKCFYFHKLMKVVFAEFENDVFLFIRFEQNNESWESENLDKMGNLDINKFKVLTPDPVDDNKEKEDDKDSIGKVTFGSIVGYIVKKDVDYFKFMYDSNIVISLYNYNKRPKFKEIYFLLDSKRSLVSLEDKSLYVLKS